VDGGDLGTNDGGGLDSVVTAAAAGQPSATGKAPFCQLCNRPGHAVSTCNRFKAMTIPQKLGVTKAFGLHRRCLDVHEEGCCCFEDNLRCPIDPDCPFRHHGLLHDPDYKPGQRTRRSGRGKDNGGSAGGSSTNAGNSGYSSSRGGGNFRGTSEAEVTLAVVEVRSGNLRQRMYLLTGGM